MTNITPNDQANQERSGISGRFYRAAGLVGAASIGIRIVQMFLPFIVAKVISRPEFGIFTIIASTVQVGADLGQVGQGVTLQKFLPLYAVRHTERASAVVNTIVAIAFLSLLIVAGLLFLFSGSIALGLYGNIHLAAYLRIAALILAASGFFNVFGGTLAGLQEFGKYSLAQLLRSLVLFLFGVFGVLVFGLMGVFVAQAMGALLAAFLIGQFASQALHARFGAGFGFRFDRRSLREIIAFSIPSFLCATLVMPAYWFALTRLSSLFGLAEVAAFGIAFGVMQLVVLIPNVTSMAAMSFLSESHAQSDGTFGSLSNLNLRVAWTVALLVSTFCAFGAPQFLHFVFKDKYAGTYAVLLGLMFTGVASAICNSVGSVLASTGRMWRVFGFNAVWLLMFGGLCVFLIPRYGAKGLALSYAGSYAAFAVITAIYANRTCQMSLARTRELTFLSILAFASAGYVELKVPQYSALLGCLMCSLLTGLCWRFVMTGEERHHGLHTLNALRRRLVWQSPPLP